MTAVARFRLFGRPALAVEPDPPDPAAPARLPTATQAPPPGGLPDVGHAGPPTPAPSPAGGLPLPPPGWGAPGTVPPTPAAPAPAGLPTRWPGPVAPPAGGCPANGPGSPADPAPGLPRGVTFPRLDAPLTGAAPYADPASSPPGGLPAVGAASRPDTYLVPHGGPLASGVASRPDLALVPPGYGCSPTGLAPRPGVPLSPPVGVPIVGPAWGPETASPPVGIPVATALPRADLGRSAAGGGPVQQGPGPDWGPVAPPATGTQALAVRDGFSAVRPDLADPGRSGSAPARPCSAPVALGHLNASGQPARMLPADTPPLHAAQPAGPQRWTQPHATGWPTPVRLGSAAVPCTPSPTDIRPAAAGPNAGRSPLQAWTAAGSVPPDPGGSPTTRAAASGAVGVPSRPAGPGSPTPATAGAAAAGPVDVRASEAAASLGRLHPDPPTDPRGFPAVRLPASDPAPEPEFDHADASALAAAFAVDVLSWDEDDPDRRDGVLRRYLGGGALPRVAAWSGRGRQRAEFALPGAVRAAGPGRLLVDVRVRVTPYAPTGARRSATGLPIGDAAGTPTPAFPAVDGDAAGTTTTALPAVDVAAGTPAVPSPVGDDVAGTPAAAPAPAARGWRSLASVWRRLAVPVVLVGDRLVVEAGEDPGDDPSGDERPVEPAPASSGAPGQGPGAEDDR